MRHLADVLWMMIDEIPIVAENKNLIENLMDIRVSAMYASPEMMPAFWCMGSQELENEFPDPNNLKDWQKKIVNIWTDTNG